jgi:hypothetical protein
MVAVSGWPVGPQAAKLRDATAAVSKSIGPGITAVEKDLEVFLAKVPNDASRQAKVDEILSVTASIRATLKSVQGETNNGALSRALGSINSDVDAIVAKYPKLTDGKSIDSVVTDAVTAATSLQNLLLTFASNPARRLLSIMAGANLGLAVAFVLHLDVFTAVDAAAPSAQAGGGVSGNLPSIWIAVTGLVMGLGSTPTHELIKALQQRKQESQPT